MLRRQASSRPDHAEVQAQRRQYEKQRADNAARLAAMRRALLYAFPATRPEALVIIDVSRRDITTHLGDAIFEAKGLLAEYDMIAAVEVRALLRRLAFEPGDRRVAELAPPQKTRQLNKRGRTLKITNDLLVRGSCGISRPFGDPKTLRAYLQSGARDKLRRRLEADAKSIYALYQYGRLHGGVRLRWGFLDEFIPAPWVHRDETTLLDLKKLAHELDVPLEIVAGSAPGWADPWARVERARVVKDPGDAWGLLLADDRGYVIDDADVQLARLPASPRVLH
jgi:hypothetical protein